MSKIDSNYQNNNYYYQPKSQTSAEMGWILATTASGLIYKALPSFSNPFLKQMHKEHANNHIYEDVFYKAVKNSGLEEKGLKIVHDANPVTDVGKGLNAYFSPQSKEIVLNTKKASISGFHELGHAMNNMKSKTGKFLQKLRRPGYAIAGLMASFALLSRSKPKEAKRDLQDFIVDNCGKIAFIAMLPTVLEESLASYKGVKMARQAGLAEAAVKNLKKFYGKALLSYGGYALISGLSVFAASKIMEKFTRPQKVEY